MKHVQKKQHAYNTFCIEEGFDIQANFLVSLGSKWCIHKASRSVLYGGTCAFPENETDKETVLHTVQCTISAALQDNMYSAVCMYGGHTKRRSQGPYLEDREKSEMEQNMDEG
jgi:hypothetical protein